MVEKLSASVMRNEMLARMQQMQLQANAGTAVAAHTQVASLSTPSFKDVMKSAIDNVDQQQHIAGQKQKAIEMGTSDDLSGTMIESQKASVAFSAMIQVRNKLTQAFDDVLNMPM